MEAGWYVWAGHDPIQLLLYKNRVLIQEVQCESVPEQVRHDDEHSHTLVDGLDTLPLGHELTHCDDDALAR